MSKSPRYVALLCVDPNPFRYMPEWQATCKDHCYMVIDTIGINGHARLMGLFPSNVLASQFKERLNKEHIISEHLSEL